jgi:hypothetical protein
MQHGDKAAKTKVSGKPVSTAFPGKALLRFAPGDNKEHLHYAAQIILDSMGLNLSIVPCAVPNGYPSGLELAGGIMVTVAELTSVFSCLSLDRERATGKRDPLGRFDETALTWDVSKPWVDLLAQKLAHQVINQQPIEISKTSSFSVHITHDVDRTTFFEPWSVFNALLRTFGLQRTKWVHLPTALSSKTLIKEFERLLEYEKEQRISAHFFMMPGPYSISRYGVRTDIHWFSWRAIAKLILDANMKIGLHGSFAAKDRNSYSEEKERLEQAIGCPVITHRNHYLRFDPMKVCNQLEKADIKYDFSIGYRTRTGFRSGTAKIHHSFDLQQQRESGLLFIPLLFMDTYLLTGDRDVVSQELRLALEQVKEVQGCVSLLFHPETLVIDPNAWFFFKRVVEMCHEMGADLSGTLSEQRK